MKLQDNDVWAYEQFGTCDLGNCSRTKRLVKVAGFMLASPEKSLPQQNVSWADTKAAYRLFDQPDVTFEAVARQHWLQTRNSRPGRYLLISDTTDIDHFSHPATEGLSQLGKGDGYGVQLHNCLVYNCDENLVEGNAGSLLHYRTQVSKSETRTQRLKRNRESEIWGTLVDEIGTAPEGSQWIHVFDRGGDNYEAMCRIHLTENDWIIRAAKLHRNVIKDGEKIALSDALEQSEVLGGYTLALRSRPGVKARKAKVEVSVVRVTLPRPRQHSPWVKQCGIDELSVNIVQVRERKAPKGVTAIRWVLFTSLDVKTFEDAFQVVEDYELRWLAEEYHKVLKTGCSIETHALRTAERLEPLIALITVIGTRLLQMKYIGRSQPDAKARNCVPHTWLQSLKAARPKIRLTDMTAYQFFRELAKFGGFLGRKHDGEPGWQTVWRGYVKLHLIIVGMQLAQREHNKLG